MERSGVDLKDRNKYYYMYIEKHGVPPVDSYFACFYAYFRAVYKLNNIIIDETSPEA